MMTSSEGPFSALPRALSTLSLPLHVTQTFFFLIDIVLLFFFNVIGCVKNDARMSFM